MTVSVISGGAGFIGTHLVGRLLRRSDLKRLHIVDNFWTSLRRTDFGGDERITFHNAWAETVVLPELVDEVYHLASPATPKYYMQDPVRTISANVAGALNLLRYLKPSGMFAYTSTSEVYGDTELSPQSESNRGWVDCTGPRGSYDEGKRCTEALLFEAERTGRLVAKVARVFNVYGPGTRPDDGRAVSNFLGQALAGQPLTIFGDGEQVRCWGYVDDIVDALERFYWLDPIDHRGPVNIGNDQEVSVRRIAEIVAQLVPGTRINFEEPIPQDPTNRRPDLTLARRLLPGWNCRIDAETGLARTLDWFKAQLA